MCLLRSCARRFRPHPSLHATFPTRGKATAVVPVRLKSASELWWNGRDVSTVRPPSSVASRHLPPQRGRLLRRDGCVTWFRSPILPSSVAGATPSPPGGRLLRQSLVVRDRADFSVRLRSKTEKICTAERSLPPGGEGGTPVPDEGETGERTMLRNHPFRSTAIQALFLNAPESPQ